MEAPKYTNKLDEEIEAPADHILEAKTNNADDGIASTNRNGDREISFTEDLEESLNIPVPYLYSVGENEKGITLHQNNI